MREDRRALAVLLLGQGLLVAIAVGIGLIVFVDPFGNLRFGFVDIVMGVVGAGALLGAMGLSRRFLPGHEALQQQMVKLLGKAGVKLDWLAIVVMGCAAGFCEEVLFRGTLQVWATRDLGLLAGLVLPNIAFALLHPHSRLYVAYVFFIGLFLAALMLASGGLTAPVVAHGLYDIVALALLARRYPELRPGIRRS